MSTQTLPKHQGTESVSSHHVGSKNLGKQIAGTYLLRESVPDDDRVFLRLVTVMADGTWLSSHARQHSQEFGFTNQQGGWHATGTHEMTAKGIDFNYHPVGGDPTSVNRIGFIMRLSKDFREVRGEMYGERYHLSQNPLNPDEIPIATFGGSFTGRRIMVDEWERP